MRAHVVANMLTNMLRAVDHRHRRFARASGYAVNSTTENFSRLGIHIELGKLTDFNPSKGLIGNTHFDKLLAGVIKMHVP